MAFLFGSPALCRVSGAQFENGSVLKFGPLTQN